MQIDIQDPDPDTIATATPADSSNTNAEPSEAMVNAYLKKNPDFFERFPETLGDIDLPELNEASALGKLNLRQLSVLREREGKSRQKLEEFLAIAGENEKLFEKTRHFVLALLDCESVDSILQESRELFEALFQVEHSVFKLISQENDSAEAFIVESGGSRHCFSGAIRENESEIIFAQPDILSCVALLRPLTKHSATKLLVAVGSRERDFYFQAIGTNFIEFLADVTQKSIDRCNIQTNT